MSSELDERRYTESIERSRQQIEGRLGEIAAWPDPGPGRIHEAIRYTLLGGGKRIRPLLCLWTHDALQGQREDACLDVACAFECLHAYSLVHDDLPCMDDDDMRRGQPSCHKKYGEAIAVLTGDALLTMCFEIIASLGVRRGLEDHVVVQVARVIGHSAGLHGLISGQALDLVSESLRPSIDVVENIHRHKTAALIAASMESGAVVAAADEETSACIRRAGSLAGEAFQIIDDVLDVEMDAKTLGKTPGKDVKEGKLTYPSVAGIEGSRARARSLLAEARSELELGAIPHRALLGRLLDSLVERSR